MAFPFMLLAAQAAGTGIGLIAGDLARQEENRFYDIGMNLERQAMETDVAMSQAALNFENQSNQLTLDMDLAETEVHRAQLNLEMEQQQHASLEQAQLSLENLRETMASQHAIFAARGQRMSGSAIAINEKPVRKYNREENARNLASDFRRLTFENNNRLLNARRGQGVMRKGLLDIETRSKTHILNIQKQSQNNLMDMRSLSRKYVQRSQRNQKWMKAGLSMMSMNQTIGPFLNG